MAPLLLAWCGGSLLLAGSLVPWLGTAAARLVGYAACALPLARTRPPSPARASPGSVALAFAAGFVALPAWLALVFPVGMALGLSWPGGAPGEEPRALAWLADVAIGPLFEELLHRERLLPALRRRLGTPLALVVGSALFAVLHGAPWSVLASFPVGIALGVLWLRSGRVALCVAYHAGLNAAVVACGLPPERLALAPVGAALASAVLLEGALRSPGPAGRAVWPGLHAVRRLVHTRARRRRSAHGSEARDLHPSSACRRSPSDS